MPVTVAPSISDSTSLNDGAVGRQPRLTVADIFRRHGPTYLNEHGVSFEQQKVMIDSVTCRTEFRGGFLEQCGQCGYRRFVFLSCGNRHCPTCGTMATREVAHSPSIGTVAPALFSSGVYPAP